MSVFAVQSATAKTATPHPLKSSKFGRFWVGATISLTGDQFYLIALPWLVLEFTSSGVRLAGVLLAAAIPRATLMFVGGALSDRISSRKILITTALGRAILVSAVAVLIWFDRVGVWTLFFLSFAFGVADAFALPATLTFMPSLVGKEQLAQANSAFQGAVQLSAIGGAAIAGRVVKTLGLGWAFLIDGISFLFILGALWGLPDPMPAVWGENSQTSLWRSIGTGMKYVNSNKGLRALVLLLAALNCLLGPMTIGLPYLAKVKFSSVTALGTWFAAFAFGTLAGALAAGVWKIARRGIVLICVAPGIMACAVLIGYITHVWLLTADLFVMGLISGFMNIQIVTWVQQNVKRDILGRVMSLIMFSVAGLMPLSLALASVALRWGVNGIFIAAGGLVLLMTALAAADPSVRTI